MTKTIAEIEAIEDTAERAAAAAKAVRNLNAQANKHRLARNHAMLTLLRDPYNWPKTKVVRHVGVSRTMFVGVVKTEPAELPEIKGAADKVAIREHQRTKDIEEQSLTLLRIRDEAIQSLLFDDRMPNHKVAEITGEHQVRIAQLRSAALA